MNSTEQTPSSRRIDRVAFRSVSGIVGILVFFGAGVTAANAQLTELNDIRGRNNFTDADRRRIAGAVDAILAKSAEAATQVERIRLAKDFRNIWGEMSSPNFKDEYAKIAAKQMSDRMLKDPGEAVLIVLLELKAYQHDRTIPVMRTGLQHSSSAVRYAAAQGIRDLWAVLPAQEVKPTLDALVQAGKEEKDSLVVREIYRTLAAAKESPEILPAMLTVFEARLKGYAKRIGWQAEQDVLEYLQSKATGLSEAVRNQIVNDVALLLAQVVPQALLDAQDKEQTEKPERWTDAQVLVDQAERLLAGLVGAGGTGLPNLRKAFQNGIDNGPEAIQLELARWLGKGDVKGVLNNAPYNVPVGGGVPAETASDGGPAGTTTAPAGGK